MSQLGWMLALSIAFVTTASAQEPPRPRSILPPREAGISFGRIQTIDIDFFMDGRDASTFEARLTFPYTPRFAFEFALSRGETTQSGFRRDLGLYTMQFKQRIVRATRGSFHPFALYGIAGTYQHMHPRQEVLPDGRVFWVPSRTELEIYPPVVVTVGGGFQHEFSRHLALRAEAQVVALTVIPLGFRGSLGLSVPFGSYPGN